MLLPGDCAYELSRVHVCLLVRRWPMMGHPQQLLELRSSTSALGLGLHDLDHLDHLDLGDLGLHWNGFGIVLVLGDGFVQLLASGLGLILRAGCVLGNQRRQIGLLGLCRLAVAQAVLVNLAELVRVERHALDRGLRRRMRFLDGLDDAGVGIGCRQQLPDCDFLDIHNGTSQLVVGSSVLALASIYRPVDLHFTLFNLL